MVDEPPNEPQFDQKSNWKDSLKSKISDALARLRRPKNAAFENSGQGDDAGGTEAFNPSAPSGDRTLTGMIRAKWASGMEKLRSPGRISAGGVMALGGFRPTWDAKTLNFYALLIAVLLVTWIAADLTALLVERFIPEAPVSRVASFGDGGNRAMTLADYQIIVSRNLFNSRGLIPGDDADTGTQDNNNVPVRTTLPLNLVGTVVLKNELRSIATIEDKSDAGMVYPVRMDDEIPGKARILAVEAYRVVFVNLSSGRREFVDLPEDPNAGNITLGMSPKVAKGGAAVGAGIEQLSSTQFNLPRGDIDKALANMNEILTQARALPNMENGMPAGYKLIQIVPDSIYTKLGLRNGDILCGVNGESINDPGKAFEALGALKTSSHMELCVKRDGKTSNFAYEIK